MASDSTPRLRTRLIAALGTTTVCTAFLFTFAGFPQVNDDRTALAIARAVADPGLYPAGDLIISSGLRVPYFAYRAASIFYSHGWPVDAWWLVLFVVATAAALLAVWMLAETLARDVLVASVATAIITAASPYRGSLHWFLFPPPNLVVSTFATPLVIGALILAIRGKKGAGLLTAAITFNLHPSLGLIATSAIGILMIADTRRTEWKSLIPWFVAAIVCVLPTILFIAHSTPTNFTASATAIHAQFRLYSDHVLPAEHWRENYGWFLLQLGGFALLCPWRGGWRTIAIFVGWFLTLIVLYVVNLFTIDYMAVNLIYLFRTAAIIKVLVWSALTVLLVRSAATKHREHHAWHLAAIGILIVGALHKNLDIGEGLAAIAWGVFMAAGDFRSLVFRRGIAAALIATGAIETLGQGWRVLHIAPFTAQGADMARMAVIIVAALFLLAAFWSRVTASRAVSTPADVAVPTDRFGAAFAAVIAVLLLALVLRGNLRALRPAGLATVVARSHLAKPPDATRAVIAWAATTPRGTLFAVPPDDNNFDWLRITAGRGVYIQIGDVNQLSYDQAVYAEGNRRVLALGTRVLERHRFDATAYGTLSADSVAALGRDGVDFAIFPHAVRATRPLAFPIAYSDSLWTVFDLRAPR